MNNGFFKIYRELWDKPIWKQSTPIQKTVLLTLLSMVNFAPAEWEWQGQKFSVQPGQTITSLQHIAERCGKGVNAGNVRGACKTWFFGKRIYKDRTPADCRELGRLPVP